MDVLIGLAAAALALFHATFAPISSYTAVLATSSLLHTASSTEATILFGGDMMFDRSVRVAMYAHGGDFIFSCIDDTLREPDLVVANLEGPITDNNSISVNSKVGDSHNYTFTFEPSVAALLAAHHIDVVNLGNNHILNFGTRGFDSTKHSLPEAGVAYFGQAAGQSWVYRTTISGVTIEFVNYNEFGGDATTTLDQIASAKRDGYLPVVYTHWGIEYKTTSSANSHELAHRFVYAGAAIVVGSHPHVVQEHELYRGKYIYYSLGNFIFDQYWNDEVRHGLMLEVAFTPAGVGSIREIPIELEFDRRTCAVQ